MTDLEQQTKETFENNVLLFEYLNEKPHAGTGAVLLDSQSWDDIMEVIKKINI